MALSMAKIKTYVVGIHKGGPQMPDSADTINPHALKAARKRHGLSQQQLAEAIGCTKDTVSRWERGKSSMVRSHLRKPLSDVLRVKWEELTKPADQTSDTFTFLNPTVRVSIAEHARASLQLVAVRYEVRPQEVLDIAPLLFVIAAERSLLEREHRLKELRGAIAHAEGLLSDHLQHLGGYVAVRDASGEDPLWEEEAALENRDVFGSQVDCEGPFLQFVRKLKNGLPKDAVVSIDSTSGGSTIGRYQVADDTLRDITGISGKEAQGEKVLDHLRSGLINLLECLRVRRDSDEGQYRQWLLDELSRADAESQHRDEDFLHSFGLSLDKVGKGLEQGRAR